MCVCVLLPLYRQHPSFLRSVRYVGVIVRLFLVLTCGFSIKLSVQKLWREKANREGAFDVTIETCPFNTATVRGKRWYFILQS